MQTTSSHELLTILIYYWPTTLSICFIGLFLCLKKFKIAFILLFLAVIFYITKSYGGPIIKIDEINEIKSNRNVLSVISYSIRSSNPNKITEVKALLKKDFDLLFLQEIEPSLMVRNLFEQLDYNVAFHANKRMITISKWPIIKSSFIGNIQKVEVQKNINITLYNLHAPKFYKNISLYNSFYQNLTSDIQSLNINSPVIIAGDFNSLPNHYWRSHLSDLNFDSSISDNGSGWKPTFPNSGRKIGILGSLLPIDDIYTRKLNIITAHVFNFKSQSDHKPIISYIEIL